MVLDDNYFKQQIQQEKINFVNRVKEILYWRDVAKAFQEHKEKGTKEMVISFPHEGNKENFEKAMFIAKQFGYKEKSGNIDPTDSVYTFVRMKA